MGVQRRESLLTASLLALGVIVSAAAVPPTGGDLFDELYLRGQQQNGKLRTLTARFVETTTSALLTRPLIARGKVAIERPSRVVLAYTEPTERLVSIDGDRLTLSWPSRGVRQTRDIGASQRRVQKYFVDSSPAELRAHFEITAQETPDSHGYLITLIPTRKQIKQGITRLDIWIDPGSLLMSSMKMTFPNGDTKLMTFSDLELNVAIDHSVFREP